VPVPVPVPVLAVMVQISDTSQHVSETYRSSLLSAVIGQAFCGRAFIASPHTSRFYETNSF
jgi:hypothetical protein